MKVLAFLQNQWLKNAAHHEKRMEHWRKVRGEEFARDLRRRQIHYALFAGCVSGRVLKRHLGAELCEAIVWDEASTVITASPSECPPADLDHMRSTLSEVNPAVVLAFGKIARDAARVLVPAFSANVVLIEAPHPAARTPAAQEEIAKAVTQLRAILFA